MTILYPYRVITSFVIKGLYCHVKSKYNFMIIKNASFILINGVFTVTNPLFSFEKSNLTSHTKSSKHQDIFFFN